MNIKELSEYARALTPVISKAINQAIESVKAEIFLEINALKAMPMPKNGIDGLPGRDGIDGKDGISITIDDILPLIPEVKHGIDGQPGLDGIDGKDGQSVSIEDFRELIDAEITRRMALIQLPADGINGKDGQSGRDGIDGKDGASVSLEDVQKLIDAEVTKRMALIQLPVDGMNGKDGQPGRDAAHIEILPGIDESKSYQRGTYAKHNGGLWRSFEQTFGYKGWECIVDGVANLSIEQEGERGFKAIASLSSGTITEKSITMPVSIYRGVWKSGIYEQGDNVTWGGSQWHCEEATEDKPGEAGSKGWRLSVKCGRNGKDGINGKDAPGVVKL